MDSGSTWSGSTLNDGLAYVPYTSSSGWRNFAGNFTGIIEVIFGANTQVQQVTDGQGRKLYVEGSKAVDTSSAGLGRSLFHLPSLRANVGARPRTLGSKYTTVGDVAIQPVVAREAAKLEAEYAADYAHGSVFITSNTNLANLAFSLAPVDSSRPVRALVHQGNQFFEVNITASRSSSGTSLLLYRPAELAANGISLRSLDGKPLSATLALGTNRNGSIRVQRTAVMTLSSSVRAKANQSDLFLSSDGVLAPTTVMEKELSPTGEQVKPSRPLAIPRTATP